ncbi:MAG TPA: amino acid adenylation domain-containing protein [Blastocatellia bacterium]|nr:amino acid adenylation domain-containing protein [Blastocatellia bacterium]
MSLLVQPTTDEAAEAVAEPLFLHRFFERAARRWPHHVALDVPPGNARPDRQRLTYAEVEAQANALAAFLCTFINGESVVAIALPRRGALLYIAQLGVLKAGAAYTCIDPAFPDEQVRDILKDSDAVALLTDAEGLRAVARLGFDRERAFDISDLIAPLRDLPVAPPSPDWLTPSSLAYIIYTSGTTGRPKGVEIEHRSISNLVSHDLETFQLSPDERVAQNSSAAYDSSVEEIWFALAAGATLVLMDDDAVRLGPDLIDWLKRERITMLCPPPTLLRTMGCEDPETELPDLSFVYVGGEVLPRDVADRWAKGRRLENGYGPTECTVTATHGRVREGEPISIGRLVCGFRGYVLNESLEEVEDGQPGELCIGGTGLARGYRNRSELTAAKFPVHPRFGRIYRTGDLVHRDRDGNYFYHSRIDAQVKLRGYRIELEAIEARLAEVEGVRQAACSVQGEGAQQALVAFVVPDDVNAPPSFDELKAWLADVLPPYMVPSRFGLLAELPTNVSNKLNRKALPLLEASGRTQDKPHVAPRDVREAQIAAAFADVLRLTEVASIDDDFFHDLGGDSLRAAQVISRLRDEAATAHLTVRDLYEARTVKELACRAASDFSAPTSFEDRSEADHFEALQGRPLLATACQVGWLLAGLVAGSSAAYFAAAEVLPRLIQRLGLIKFLMLGPFLFFAGLVVYAPLAILVAAGIKRLLIGRYRPLRAPAWGSFYVRNWMVQQTVRIIPWWLLEGTVFQQSALRALGARIGHRVHIHRGVNVLQGGWDLLDIGDDVTISQDASLRLVDFEDGQVVVGAIRIGEGSTLDIRAGVGGNTVLEPGAYLTASSSLGDGDHIPRGECWDGIPARPAGAAPPRPAVSKEARQLSPHAHGVALIGARFALGLLLALPFELPLLALALVFGVDAERALDWLDAPSLKPSLLLIGVLLVTLPGPLMLMTEALAMRALGRVQEGVISRWSLAYVRVWLKTQMVQSAGEWLSGTLFWPVWLRMAGMKIGRNCEISTITDVVPELVEIGRETFFADGIYLAGPRVHRGAVALRETRLGVNTFLGNHVVIPAGQQMPDDVLLGVCTVADDTRIWRGSSWFGHPPFELPRREVVECDRSLTHNPSLMRYVNRVFWELLRFAVPAMPALVLPVWFGLLAWAERAFTTPVFYFAVVPLVSMAAAAFFCLLVLVMKWGLLGRVRPGVHPLWSCWCSRWDFLYVAWGIYARTALSAIEGTLLLSCYLRAMGMKIGRRVVLGSGFAHVVDPDMLHFEDGATVSCQFQAHTFEDRVLKIDHVRIGRGASVGGNAVLLYGADIGAGTRVAPHSVVMKRERLLAGRDYAGCPTRPARATAQAVLAAAGD